MNAPPRNQWEELQARLVALEARPDLAGPVGELLARTKKLEDTLPEDQLVSNSQAIGAAGVEGETGPWTAPVLNAKAKSRAVSEPVAVRKEDAGTAARLRGAIEATEEIAAEATLLTLPEGFRPAKEILIATSRSGGVVTIVTILPTGVLKSTGALPAGTFIPLDSETFNLT